MRTTLAVIIFTTSGIVGVPALQAQSTTESTSGLSSSQQSSLQAALESGNADEAKGILAEAGLTGEAATDALAAAADAVIADTGSSDLTSTLRTVMATVTTTAAESGASSTDLQSLGASITSSALGRAQALNMGPFGLATAIGEGIAEGAENVDGASNQEASDIASQLMEGVNAVAETSLNADIATLFVDTAVYAADNTSSSTTSVRVTIDRNTPRLISPTFVSFTFQVLDYDVIPDEVLGERDVLSPS